MKTEYDKLSWDNTIRIYYDKNSNWAKIVTVDNN